MSIDFIFIRHGQTDWTRNDICKGPIDFDLNQIGREEADKIYDTITKYFILKTKNF